MNGPDNKRQFNESEQEQMNEAYEKAVESLTENEIADLIMEHLTSGISDEPRTIRGTFPGPKNLAMGAALEVVEMCEEDGVDAEREYIGEGDQYDGQQVIDIHIEGGSDEEVVE